jgi:hypothetical protein
VFLPLTRDESRVRVSFESLLFFFDLSFRLKIEILIGANILRKRCGLACHHGTSLQQHKYTTERWLTLDRIKFVIAAPFLNPPSTHLHFSRQRQSRIYIRRPAYLLVYITQINRHASYTYNITTRQINQPALIISTIRMVNRIKDK